MFQQLIISVFLQRAVDTVLIGNLYRHFVIIIIILHIIIILFLKLLQIPTTSYRSRPNKYEAKDKETPRSVLVCHQTLE